MGSEGKDCEESLGPCWRDCHRGGSASLYPALRQAGVCFPCNVPRTQHPEAGKLPQPVLMLSRLSGAQASLGVCPTGSLQCWPGRGAQPRGRCLLGSSASSSVADARDRGGCGLLPCNSQLGLWGKATGAWYQIPSCGDAPSGQGLRGGEPVRWALLWSRHVVLSQQAPVEPLGFT